ncbi:MAG TPA: sulfotransferase [Gammaproteobacteria bacterium]|nr:sulfotransferase [Gammaproteobacteria bacterium]
MMGQSAALDNEQLFFCFGPPKSGTTFLQRTLNLHPEISCPSEHQFNLIVNGLEELVQSYQNTLQVIDRRTGGQGVAPMQKPAFTSIFRFYVESMIKEAAKNGEPIIGANDNAIRKNLDLYDEIFNHPRMIYIFRYPADMAISAWHHNLRLAREENDPAHEQYMAQYGDFDGWVRQYARWFMRDVNAYRAFSKNHSNIILVRYEDLVSAKRKTLREIFDFLGADKSDDILESIEHKSSLSYMRKQSSNPAFFRSASIDMGAGELSEQLRRDVTEIAGDALKFLDYGTKS